MARPNDKLAVYGIDDPVVDGIACHYTAPERGGLAGAFGLAEQTSDISLACRQYGPIKFKAKFEQGEDVFRQRRSLFFKKMQIVRGCDTKRNVLVYMVYSDRLIEGSPKNSTSTVPERGGLKGWIGVAEEVSDISLACRQIGPIVFKAKFEQGEDVFRKRRSLFFKKMQIVRGCDTKRNVLVYMVYSDRLIEGSPKNSTSTVPVMPWGGQGDVQKCADWVEK